MEQRYWSSQNSRISSATKYRRLEVPNRFQYWELQEGPGWQIHMRHLQPFFGWNSPEINNKPQWPLDRVRWIQTKVGLRLECLDVLSYQRCNPYPSWNKTMSNQCD